MNKIPLFKVYMSSSITDELNKILYSGYIGEGAKSKEFEKALQDYFQNDNLLLTNSGTSSIHLALDVIRETHQLIPQDTEVLCTCFSCLATAMPIESQGFKIKWVDINPNSLNIDLDDLERKLSPTTRVVMIVHFGGLPVDLDRIEELKRKYKETFNQELFVIEDSAQCLASYWGDRLIGNSGNYCAFSMQAIKFLTTADGGFVITPDREATQQLKLKRWFGLDREAGQDMRCTQSVIYNGFKMQPNDILSTIGLCNLQGALEHVEIHQDNAEYYNKELDGVSGLKLIEVPKKAKSSWWLYTLFVDNKMQFKKMMASKGIAVSEVHVRMDTHPIYNKYKAFLPNMDSVQDKYIAIPVGWWVTPSDREYIVKCIKEGW